MTTTMMIMAMMVKRRDACANDNHLGQAQDIDNSSDEDDPWGSSGGGGGAPGRGSEG